MYDYVHHLEKNEFLKKNNMLRNMHAKVHFYEKLELNKYQKAYQKIATSLKEIEDIGQRGELSYLNDNSMYVSNLNVSKNRSILQRNQHSMNESINQDMSQMNFLDGLDSQIMGTSMIQRPQSILDLIQKLKEKFKIDKFNDLNFISIEMFFKHVKEFITTCEENVVTLNVDPKNRNEHNKLNENRAEQNYEFYMFCLEEFREKSNFCENRFKIINLLLKNREVSLEERESEKFYQLISSNKVLMDEDKLNFQDDIDKIELLKMIEESYLKKKNILGDRRNFMNIIEKKVESIKKDLDRVLNNLNRYEDKYMLNLATHKENKKKIELNTLQMREIREESKEIQFQVKEQMKEIESTETNLKEIKDKKQMLEEENSSLVSKIKDLNNSSQKNQNEIMSLTQSNTNNKVYIIELEETCELLQKLLKSKTKEKTDIDLKKKEEEEKFNKLLSKVNPICP
jgi:hypothetical protein